MTTTQAPKAAPLPACPLGDRCTTYDRLEELRAERADLAEAAKEGDRAYQMQKRAALRKWDEINGDELKALTYAAGAFLDTRHDGGVE